MNVTYMFVVLNMVLELVYVCKCYTSRESLKYVVKQHLCKYVYCFMIKMAKQWVKEGSKKTTVYLTTPVLPSQQIFNPSLV